MTTSHSLEVCDGNRPLPVRYVAQFRATAFCRHSRRARHAREGLVEGAKDKSHDHTPVINRSVISER